MFSSGRENAIFSAIMGNDVLAEKIKILLSIEFYQPQPLFLSFDRPHLEGYSIEGLTFAKDGGGGEYVLLADGTIGYSGQETECGRVAENFIEYLELELNCIHGWYNYSRADFMNDSSLLQQEVEKRELEAMQYIAREYGGEIGKVHELKIELAKMLKLEIFNDISKDILPRFFKAATREPLYFWEDTEMQERSDDLVR